MDVTLTQKPEVTADGAVHQATILYTNHRGETASRTVTPIRVWYGESPYHDGAQWFLEAVDAGRSAVRSFAMCDIHEWTNPQVHVRD